MGSSSKKHDSKKSKKHDSKKERKSRDKAKKKHSSSRHRARSSSTSSSSSASSRDRSSSHKRSRPEAAEVRSTAATAAAAATSAALTALPEPVQLLVGMLCSFPSLPVELASLLEAVDAGEAVCLDGVANEKLKDQLGTLLVHLGLERQAEDKNGLVMYKHAQVRVKKTVAGNDYCLLEIVF